MLGTSSVATLSYSHPSAIAQIIRVAAMWSCGVIILHVLLVLSNAVRIESKSDDLSKNFLDNLEEAFAKRWNSSTEQEIQTEIDSIVNDYVNLGNGSKKRFRRDAKWRGSDHLKLIGFEEMGSIPVSFPLDLCLMSAFGATFAVALHANGPQFEETNSTDITFLQLIGMDFEIIYQAELQKSQKMDCISVGDLAFVTVVGHFRRNTKDPGSPIFQILPTGVTVIQFNRMEHQLNARFWSHGNDIFLMQTYKTSNMPAEIQKRFLCPIYKLSFTDNFQLWDELPCSNTVTVETFNMNGDFFLALANNMNEKNSTRVPSVIYRLDEIAQKFVYHQAIVTDGAVDLKHFRTNDEDYLIVANSPGTRDDSDLSHSIVYKHSKGNFLPFQSIHTDDVTSILPVIVSKDQVILLFSSNEESMRFFEYDGWKFHESAVRYTTDSFEIGISRMREYRFGESSVIVIANRRVFGETQNVFQPQFKSVPNYDVHGAMLEWCQESIIELTSTNLQGLLQALKNLPKVTDEVLEFPHGMAFESLKVENLLTDELITPEWKINKEIAEKINSTSERAEALGEKLNIINETLRNFLNANSDQLTKEILTQDNAEEVYDFEELTVDEVTAEFINGQPFESLIRTDVPLNLSKVDLVCKNATISSKMNVTNLLDGIKFDRDHILLKNSDPQHLNFTALDTLIVRDLQMTSINSINFSDIVKALRELKPTGPNVTVLKAENLFVTGSLNGVDLAFLEKYALRLEGNQIITEATEIDHLVANQVNIFKKISGRNVSDIVLASHGDYLIDRPVSFESNFSVEKLNVTNRLNHIEVFDGKLDVVLKNSTEMQIIEGKKTFNQVKLLRPIVLRGKIKSESLKKMNPMASINKSLVLHGDYFISGPVTVKRFLRASDILSGRDSLSLQRMFNDGLKKDTMEVHQNINFQQPLKITDFYTKSINGIDPENFVKINTDEIQPIYGKKYFMNDITVNEGFCEADIIQGVNLTELNLNILHKTGDETVEGDIQFRKITANSVKGDKVKFSGKDFNNFLHFDKEQNITGKVTLKKPVSVKENLTIGDLHSKGKVSGVSLSDLIADTARKGERIILTGKKIFTRGLTIGNLDVDHLPNLNVSHIDGKFFGAFGGKLIWDSVEFPNEMNIKEMTFTGSLNNIAASDFGNCWLLTEGDQEFTAPQIFSRVVAQEGALLLGELNERDLEELLRNSYFINRKEELPTVEFLDEVTLIEGLSMNGTLSGVLLPQILNKKGAKTPYRIPKLTINGDLIVEKRFQILNYINNISLSALEDFVWPSSANTPYNLVVHGNAEFNMEPKVIYLNGFDIANTFKSAFMVYNKIYFTEPVHLCDAVFMERIDALGKVNDINFTHVAANYMSLSKPQTISTRITFHDDVTLEAPLSASQMHLGGHLRTVTSGETVKVEELDEMAAKSEGDQIISGEWVVDSIELEGDAENLRINDLNVEKDVMRYDVEFNNVTGLKRFHHLVVENLQCATNCILQGVDVKDWYTQAVFLIGNHTVHGTVTLKMANFQTDIKVHGLVNNITFNRDTVLTKDFDQTIQGNVYIDNRSRDKMSLHSLAFHWLEAERINGMAVDDFLENIAMQDDYKSGGNLVESPVVFEKPLIVENLYCRGSLFGVNMTEMGEEMQMAQKLSVLDRRLTKLHEKAKTIVGHHRGSATFVSEYSVAQIIRRVIKKIVPIHLMRNGRVNLYLAILAADPNATVIDFYRLEEFQRQTFVESDIKPIRYENSDPVSIYRLNLLGQDYLFTEIYSTTLEYKQTISNYVHDQVKVIYERFTNTPRRIAVVRQERKQECIVEYSVKDSQVSVECLIEMENGKTTFEPYQKLTIPGVREIMPLRTNMFAILTINGTVSVLEHRPGEKWQTKQSVSIINPLDMSSETFEGKVFMAVCSGQTKNSLHHGSVEIFRHSGKNFLHFQDIPIESPIRIEFSILPTGEFVLYVLTSNSGQPLIVYKYSGVSGFQKFTEAATIPRGNRLTVIRIPKFRKEFAAVLSPNEVTLIEAIVR